MLWNKQNDAMVYKQHFHFYFQARKKHKKKNTKRQRDIEITKIRTVEATLNRKHFMQIPID